MYFYFKRGDAPPRSCLAENVTIKKRIPHQFVENMHFMQIGKKRFWYYLIMTFLYRGFSRVYKEYDVIVDGIIVSKAVLISKVPIYQFLPAKGVHLCYCETISEARGKGYYPFLLSYIQKDCPNMDLYMAVDEANKASLRGVEKAGFVKYGYGPKMANGKFVITNLF